MVLSNPDEHRRHMMQALPGVLPGYLMRQRWFGGKARVIRSVEVLDVIPAGDERAMASISLFRVQFADGDSHVYALPLAALRSDREAALQSEGRGNLAIAVPASDAGEANEEWCDALWDPIWPRVLLEAIAQGRVFRGSTGELQGVPTRALARLRGDAGHDLAPSVMSAEQSNTSVRFDQRLILKLFRRLQTGVNPDVEICTFLTERTSYAHFPAVGGTLVWRQGDRETSLAILQAFVPNRGDAWKYTLEALESYFVRLGNPPRQPAPAAAPLFALLEESLPSSVEAEMDGYPASARLLGERTGQLHLALASVADSAAFSPEPFTPSYQQGLSEFMLDLSTGVFAMLRRRLGQLEARVRAQAEDVLQRQALVADRLQSVRDRPISAMRIRVHGDFHLGQVLYTGDDFVIIDFEGEPARSVSDRRIKRSPLRDVAGMLRSFHYAAFSGLLRRAGSAPGRDGPVLESWARCWQSWASAAFLQAYLSVAQGSPFLPKERDELEMLLQAYLLEKAVYELGYELNNRPDWVRIPLQGIQDVLNSQT